MLETISLFTKKSPGLFKECYLQNVFTKHLAMVDMPQNPTKLRGVLVV